MSTKGLVFTGSEFDYTKHDVIRPIDKIVVGELIPWLCSNGWSIMYREYPDGRPRELIGMVRDTDQEQTPVTLSEALEVMIALASREGYEHGI